MTRSVTQLSVLFTLIACSEGAAGTASTHAADSTAVLAALSRYATLATAMDHEGVGRLFADSGQLVRVNEPPVVGPAAITAYLQTFKDFHVHENTLTADTTQVTADSARQIGRYHQRVTLPDGRTVEVSGHFAITWHKADGAWHIRRLQAAGDP